MDIVKRTGSPRPDHVDWVRCRLGDAELVSRILAGDTAAFEGVMRRYNQRLFRIARGILGNDADAQDAVQEAYVRAYYRLSQFEGPDGFAGWLSRIVVNEALGRVRRRSLAIDDARDADELPTPRKDRPEDAAMSTDTLELIESAIDALPRDFRIVFMLRAVEGLTVEETAASLDIKPATVKTRYFRAKELLKTSLTRRIEETVPSSFSFAGARCDRIVHEVFASLAGANHSSTGGESQ